MIGAKAPPERWEELRSVSHLLTQLPSPGVGAFHVGGGLPLGGYQRRAKRHLEVQLLLQAFRGLRQPHQHGQPLPQVRDGFHIRRAFNRTLTRPLPVVQSRFVLGRFGIVMRHQLRLRLHHLGKPCF